MGRLQHGIILLTILAAGALPAVPATAQSSWWDKNATPAAMHGRRAAAPEAPAPEAEAGLTLAPPMRRRDIPLPRAVVPLFLGAVQLIGPHGKRYPANIIGVFTGGTAYLVQTRKGTQVVGLGEIIDPLLGPCPVDERRASNALAGSNKRLY